jgi:hypothetical protein
MYSWVACFSLRVMVTLTADGPDRAPADGTIGTRRPYAHTPSRISVRIRTRLYTPFVKAKIHPTFSRPR